MKVINNYNFKARLMNVLFTFSFAFSCGIIIVQLYKINWALSVMFGMVIFSFKFIQLLLDTKK